MPVVDSIALHETAQNRYLNYALSVITSRALPDLRDGLKPVQRRILYAMFTNLRLLPEGRFRKSATVVGEVMGKYHPHGDSAIYEAMVRMAQDFSLRAPLVDGHGNFGSLDGDNPAAMRYTEAKLRPLAVELLGELRKQTVAFRPTFDGTLSEPVVLPARFPNLLVNGASGIAVGMATNIPPHNLAEVVDACLRMVDSPNVKLETLLSYVKGPDFPTGGRILNTTDEIASIYEKGEGAVEMRGEYVREGKQLILTSIPYGMSKADLIEKIAVHIAEEKVPQLVDIRDESTDEVRVVLELKRGSSADAAMAYLFKHTPLQSKFHVNLTCLVPTDNPQISAPQKVDLITMLRGFLDFRMEVIVKRTQYDLDQLERRIHILKGLEDHLRRARRVHQDRSARPRTRATRPGRLMHRFQIDDEQTDAILELKLYRLAQLEINLIRKELNEKEGSAAELRLILSDEGTRWKMVKKELREVKAAFGEERRTEIAGPDPEPDVQRGGLHRVRRRPRDRDARRLDQAAAQLHDRRRDPRARRRQRGLGASGVDAVDDCVRHHDGARLLGTGRSAAVDDRARASDSEAVRLRRQGADRRRRLARPAHPARRRPRPRRVARTVRRRRLADSAGRPASAWRSPKAVRRRAWPSRRSPIRPTRTAAC